MPDALDATLPHDTAKVAQPSVSRDGDQGGGAPGSNRWRTRLATLSGRLALLALILVAWQLASGRVINRLFVSRPTAIANRLWTWVTDGTLAHNLPPTFEEMLLGFALGSIAGIALGLVVGRTPYLARLLSPYLTAIYSVPPIALAPLFIVWFGIGLTSKVMLTALIVFFLVFTNAFAGARGVDEDILDVVSLMGAKRHQRFVKVVFPWTLEWVFTGLRLGVPHALVGAVVGEIIASSQGLGYLVRSTAGVFDTTGTFAALAVLVILGVLINGALDVVSTKGERWRHLG